MVQAQASLLRGPQYHVIYDRSAKECFRVHKKDGTKGVFKTSKRGYYTQVLTMTYSL